MGNVIRNQVHLPWFDFNDRRILILRFLWHFLVANVTSPGYFSLGQSDTKRSKFSYHALLETGMIFHWIKQ